MSPAGEIKDRRNPSTLSRRNPFFHDRRKSDIQIFMVHDPERLEELVIQRIAEKASEFGLNFKQHALKAGISKAPDVTWRAIRNGRQKLTVEDMVRLLNVISVEPATIFFEAQEIIKMEERTQTPPKKAATSH